MTVTNVEKDLERLTMVITAEFNASIDDTWQLWENPRKLERWWGPPTFPATFVEHDLRPGSIVKYFMSGPNGEQPHGWWKVMNVEAPRHLEFEDGFADNDGNPNPSTPVIVMTVDLREQGDGTR